MKKFITSMFAMAAIAASAQNAGQISSEALGLPEDYDENSLAETTVVAEVEGAVKMHLLVAEPTKKMSTSLGAYKQIKVGDAVISGSDGMQGKNNPKAPSILSAATEAGTYLSFPDQGFVPVFDVEKDGFIYAVGKLTFNKNYYVLEWTSKNGFTAGHDAIAYTVAGVAPDVKDGILGNTDGLVNYTVTPSNEEGYYTGRADIPNVEQLVLGAEYVTAKLDEGTAAERDTFYWSMDKYTAAIAASATWAEAGKIAKNFFGVIKFPVYAGMSYAAFGRGTKISISGFIFSEKDLDVVAVAPESTAEDGTVTPESSIVIAKAGEAGGEQGGSEQGGDTPTPVKVINANVELDANSPVYNILGQKVENVNKAGVYIQNGKKFLVK